MNACMHGEDTNHHTPRVLKRRMALPPQHTAPHGAMPVERALRAAMHACIHVQGAGAPPPPPARPPAALTDEDALDGGLEAAVVHAGAAAGEARHVRRAHLPHALQRSTAQHRAQRDTNHSAAACLFALCPSYTLLHHLQTQAHGLACETTVAPRAGMRVRACMHALHDRVRGWRSAAAVARSHACRRAAATRTPQAPCLRWPAPPPWCRAR